MCEAGEGEKGGTVRDGEGWMVCTVRRKRGGTWPARVVPSAEPPEDAHAGRSSSKSKSKSKSKSCAIFACVALGARCTH